MERFIYFSAGVVVGLTGFILWFYYALVVSIHG
jgi:hypothetical protein